MSAPPAVRLNWPPGSGAVRHYDHKIRRRRIDWDVSRMSPVGTWTSNRTTTSTVERPPTLPVSNGKEPVTVVTRRPRSVRKTAFYPERAVAVPLRQPRPDPGMHHLLLHRADGGQISRVKSARRFPNACCRTGAGCRHPHCGGPRAAAGHGTGAGDRRVRRRPVRDQAIVG
jgi:hypothetical protein